MILELIASIGLMWALKHGGILNRPRSFLTKRSAILKELFNCSLCLGFWSGVLISIFCYNYTGYNYLLLIFPFASSALSWFFDSLLDLIQLSCCKLDK
jgi:hypothetical protein